MFSRGCSLHKGSLQRPTPERARHTKWTRFHTAGTEVSLFALAVWPVHGHMWEENIYGRPWTWELPPLSAVCPQSASLSCCSPSPDWTWRFFPWCRRGNIPSRLFFSSPLPSSFLSVCVWCCWHNFPRRLRITQGWGVTERGARGVWPLDLWPQGSSCVLCLGDAEGRCESQGGEEFTLWQKCKRHTMRQLLYWFWFSSALSFYWTA